MTHPDPSYSVSDTAALVMLWASNYYAQNPLINPYLQRLDLSRGRSLVDRYNMICPWYSEVIINRKHFIRSMAGALAAKDSKPALVVNLGAGFSPLTLELALRLPDRIRFAELDVCNMETKTKLYTELMPDRCSQVSCISADIGNTAALYDTLSPLLDPDTTRLIVVMEGLSYYLSKSVMERAISALSGLARDRFFIFEHLKPCRQVSDDRRYIPYKIFSHVRDYTGMKKMTTYSADEIRAMFGNGFLFSYYNMDEMELRRTGKQTYFPTPDSGWLSCAVLAGKNPLPESGCKPF